MLQRVYTRVSKPTARYSDRGSMAEHCSACRFFMSGGDCARVLGRVLPQGWCKYFSQEAVQRWNPLWQMAGIPAPPGATLDLSFLTSGSLDPRITFTRASTATYFNYAGVMQIAPANAPRWDYNPSTLALQGLLLEDARTNLVLNSGDVSNASWQKANNVMPLPVATANQTTAPDGTLTAGSVAYTLFAGAGGYSNVFFTETATAAPYAFSVYMKGTVGGEQLYIMATPDGVLFYRTLVTLTTAWQRFALVTSALTAAAWYFQIGLDLRDAGQSLKPSATVYMWGAQIEQSNFASSYIPTVAATVTRAVDVCGIPSGGMGWFTSPGGSWQAEFIGLNPSGNSTRIIAAPGVSTAAPLLVEPALRAAQYDGVGTLFSANAITVGAVVKAASTYAPGTGRECLNAGAVASGALTTGYGSLSASGIGLLTVAPAGNAQNTSGYIRNLRYWPRVLSSAEMQSVTT